MRSPRGDTSCYDLSSSATSSDSTDPPSISTESYSPDLNKFYRRIETKPSFTNTSFADKSPPVSLYSLSSNHTAKLFAQNEIKQPHRRASFSDVNVDALAVHLARRQAQAARIMAENSLSNVLRPCKYLSDSKECMYSPRRLRYVFRAPNQNWKSQYLDPSYIPMEITQEFQDWRRSGAESEENNEKALSKKSWFKCPCAVVKRASPVAESVFEDTPSSPLNSISERDIEVALKRSCRLKRPWATVLDQIRASETHLIFTGINILKSLATERGEWDGTFRLDYRRQNSTKEPCVTDKCWLFIQKLICDDTPLGELAAYSDQIIHNVTLSLRFLNITQLCALRQRLRGSRRVCVNEMTQKCESVLCEELWNFVSQRTLGNADEYVQKNDTAFVEVGLRSVAGAGESRMLSEVPETYEAQEVAKKLLVGQKWRSERCRIGARILLTLGGVDQSEKVKTQLLETPLTFYATRQLWWLIYCNDISASVARFFLRVPSLEMCLEQPSSDVEVYSLNLLRQPVLAGGSCLWVIRELEPGADPRILEPVDCTRTLARGLSQDPRFLEHKRRLDATATLTATSQALARSSTVLGLPKTPSLPQHTVSSPAHKLPPSHLPTIAPALSPGNKPCFTPQTAFSRRGSQLEELLAKTAFSTAVTLASPALDRSFTTPTLHRRHY